jgi:hypothetical protein
MRNSYAAELTDAGITGPQQWQRIGYEKQGTNTWYDPVQDRGIFLGAKDIPYSQPGFVSSFYGWDQNPQAGLNKFDSIFKGSTKNDRNIQNSIGKYLNQQGTNVSSASDAQRIAALDYAIREEGRKQQTKGGGFLSSIAGALPSIVGGALGGPIGAGLGGAFGSAATGKNPLTGGITNLVSNYVSPFAEGGYLNGRGDGMSDDIPANINGSQPARLSDGEFIIPADVVSHLGNGSSNAGANKLYAMLDRVRETKTGTIRQAPMKNMGGYLPA